MRRPLPHLKKGALREYVIAFVVLSIMLLAAESLWASTARWLDERRPIEDWVEYHAIEFINEDPTGRGGLGSLRMLSDRTIHAEVRLSFIDTLKCSSPASGNKLEFVSQNPATQSFSTGPSERERSGWLYNADYPRGADCFVESTVIAERNGVEKATKLRTPYFVLD